MTDQVFFDVPLSAQFADGAVRIELGIYKGEMKDKKRNVTPGATLVTTLPGILQLQGQINQLVEGLVEFVCLLLRSAVSLDSNIPF